MSAKFIVEVARDIASHLRVKVILFIRDEDGPAKQTIADDDPNANGSIGGDGDGLVDVHPHWAQLIYEPGALTDNLCVISRLNYSSILPKCSCAILDGGHAITGMLIASVVMVS